MKFQFIISKIYKIKEYLSPYRIKNKKNEDKVNNYKVPKIDLEKITPRKQDDISLRIKQGRFAEMSNYHAGLDET